jgi:hypothetical protein
MRQSLITIFLLALALAAPSVSAQARSDYGTINIMRPEPHARASHYRSEERHRRRHERVVHRHAKKGYGAKEETRRGSSNPVYPTPLPGPQKPLPVPHYQVTPPQRAATPPPLLVPETGRFVPNLPPAVGTAPKESFPERAARCQNQAAINGPNVTGNPSAYINSCINQ